MDQLQKSTPKIAIEVKSIFFLVGSALLVYGSFIALKTSNATTTSTPSGTCGGVITVRTAADGALDANQSATINSGGFLDFTNGKFSLVDTRQTGRSGSQAVWTQRAITNRDMTIISDPELSGTYQVTAATQAEIGINLVFRLIPVNGGTTYLLQGKNVGATGMCQKV